jgi:hypothetical protein
MRFASTPMSLWPTREAERTSTRLPEPLTATRITRSSLKPNSVVVSVASVLPSAGTRAIIS